MIKNRKWLWLAAAFLSTLPALILRLGGIEVSPLLQSAISGLGILGAAFLLAWAAEVAEMDISQALALALLALIAVLPEYSVDLYFAWTAAYKPDHIAYATANMTGGNRLLIGVGWSLVVFLFWFKTRHRILHLEPSHRTELLFLTLATLYSFTIPFKGYIAIWDAAVLVGLFVLYLWAASKAEHEEPELVGPALAVAALPVAWRRLVTLFLFLFAGAVILASAEPFAEGLVATGKAFGISEFLLVQWVAPLASEAPEVVVVILFTLKGHAAAGMGTLISSKVNQWTLLVGTLPIVYSISLGRLSGLPLDGRQMEELFLTSAQSAFAVAVLASLSISVREALLLFLLFSAQLLIPVPAVRYAFAGLYLFLAALVLVRDKSSRAGLVSLASYGWGLLGRSAGKGVEGQAK
ncbi:MAG: sodium:calcium antiporter [Chloroflexi bacterium]|nr:sodium:calcium antiporter [Chloroflexota bacterium]